MQVLTEFDIKSLLKDAYTVVQESSGVHPVKEYKAALENQDAFNTYVEALSQGLSPRDEMIFKKLASNLREVILTESNFTTAYSAYNSLLLPLLRIFFPRLVAREAVSIDPMEKPFIVRYFLRAIAKKPDNTMTELPDYSGTASSGPQIPATTLVTLTDGRGSGNLITLAGYSSGSLQRDLLIVSTTDGTDTVTVNVSPDTITGTAEFQVTYPTSNNTDRLIVKVNYDTGEVDILSVNDHTTGVYFSGTLTMESNDPNQLTTVELKLEPYQIAAVSRKLNIRWSPEFEQDVKALFDIDAQSQLLSLLGAQIATDVDREILNDLALGASSSMATQDTFSITPPANFAFGPKQWYENIVVHINYLAGQIYQKTAIAPGNIIITSPKNVAILQSTGEYSKLGDLTTGVLAGTTPYAIGEFSNAYKVLVTQLMPDNFMLVILKPQEPAAAVYAYMPYIPTSIYPWPMTTIPSLTFMTRYAKRLFRPQGLAKLTITS
jgi:hypothetical protein